MLSSNPMTRRAGLSERHFDDLLVDVEARAVAVAGQEVHLTRTEFDLLRLFIDHPRQALSRQRILGLVWGGAWFGDDHLVSVHVSNLRQKIAERRRPRRLISTIHGYGYRFDGVESSGGVSSRRGQLDVG